MILLQSSKDFIICHPLVREGPFDRVRIFKDQRVAGSDSMLSYEANDDGDWYYEEGENPKICYICKYSSRGGCI